MNRPHALALAVLAAAMTAARQDPVGHPPLTLASGGLGRVVYGAEEYDARYDPPRRARAAGAGAARESLVRESPRPVAPGELRNTTAAGETSLRRGPGAGASPARIGLKATRSALWFGKVYPSFGRAYLRDAAADLGEKRRREVNDGGLVRASIMRVLPGEHVELFPDHERGSSSVDDGTPGQSLAWNFLQPRLRLGGDVHAVLRYSEIGTHEDEEGYFLEGRIGVQGRRGYGTKLLQRLSAGVGWEVNPDTLVKLEVGQDWFDLIDGSPFREDDGRRTFMGLQLVLSF